MRAIRPALALVGVATLVATALAATPAAAANTNVTRSCAKPTRAHVMACHSLRRTDIITPKVLTPNATPSGYGPSSLQSAYALASVAASAGSGVTVAIVDAYNDPNAESDLAAYRSQYGLPACGKASGCFTQVNQTGGSTLPANNTGWAGEIALDLDMVSAICPNCKILLVEANSASDADLYAAEDYAAAHAKYVSNSWGGGEYSGQTTDDSHFNHPGVAITVSSGDNGNGSEYPATSRYVTAVGGTSLSTASNSRGWTESAWSGAGSGCSAYDTKPTWQTVTTGCTRRAEADVSVVADPNTGVAVYITYGTSGYSLKTFSLAAYAGTTITLTFTATEDSSLQTSFVVDDTAVTVS